MGACVSDCWLPCSACAECSSQCAPVCVCPSALFDPDLTDEKIRDFSLGGERHLAVVTDVYDGDTLRVKFRRRGDIVQFKVRMLGYDSPEIRPPRKQFCAEACRKREIAAGVVARNRIAALVLGKLVWVECGGWDKYGRLLAKLYLCTARKTLCGMLCVGENVNQWMVSSGLGVPYGGGARRAPACAACAARAD